ncbi:MAG: uroporphyrinogen-III synthase [Planctomycetaceae bacterium]
MRSLIARQGGLATIAPSMREIPLEQNEPVFSFGEKLIAGKIDIAIFLTGVGTQTMLDVLLLRHSREELVAAINRCVTVVRGPKPVAVLKNWEIRVDHRAPEPNTWKELLIVVDRELAVSGKTIALQEYGKPSTELHVAIRDRGAALLTVPVYRWDLPENVGPLQEAIRSALEGKFDVLLFTSAQQIAHVLLIANQMGIAAGWKESAARCVIASIGPTCSEALREAGLVVDLEPTHPKMGWLVKEAYVQAPAILERKRP